MTSSESPLVRFWESRAVPIAIVAIGAALRLGYVGSSYCIDDLSALEDSAGLLPTSINRFRPLFFTLLHFWRSLGPDTEWWIQLLSCMLSIAAIPLAWMVGRRFGGRTVAAALSLLLAVSPIHLDLSAEIRIYSLLSVLGLLQLLCYLRYRETGGIWPLIANALVGAAAMYTQPIYGLFLFGLFVLSLLDRRRIRFWPPTASLAGIGILYLPNLIYVWQFARHAYENPAVTHVSTALFKLITAYSVGFTYFRVEDLGLGAKFGMREVLANAPLVTLAAFTFLLIIMGAVRKLRQAEEQLTWKVILSLAILPFALAYAGVVVFERDFTHAHFHIASLPLILLLFVKGFQGLSRPRLLQIGAVALYAVVIGLSVYHFLFDSQHYGRRVDWRGAARFIEQHVSPDEPLLLFAPTTAKGYDYPYLLHYAAPTQSAWQSIAAPRTLDPENYSIYLRHRLTGYETVYYMWDADLKNVLDPRNVIVGSFRLLAAEESREIFNPRLKIYRWKLRE